MLNNESRVCMVPFRELHINSQGKYRNCCIQKNTMGRITLDIEDSNEWFSRDNEINIIRNALKNNIQHPSCGTCWKLEEQQLSSYRKNWNQQYISRNDTELDTKIEVIDLRLGNRCNLKCRMCNSTWSNLISEQIEELKLKGIVNTFTHMPVTGIVKQSDKFMDDLFHFVKATPTLREIKLAGGEPFVMDEVEEFINKLVEHRITNLEISVTTNTTVVKDEVIQLLEKFSSTHIQCSIDGMGELLEYQRFPSKWSVIERNFSKLYNSKLTVNLTPCWSNLNILSMADFLAWSSKFPKSHVAYNEVKSPSYLDWRFVPLEARQQMLNQFSVLDLHSKVHKDYTKFIEKFQTEVKDYTKEEKIKFKDAVVCWDALGKVPYQNLHSWNTEIINIE